MCNITKQHLKIIDDAIETVFTWKYGLQADKTTLCACIWRPSAESVTSTSDLSCTKAENVVWKLSWWLSHRKHNGRSDISLLLVIINYKKKCFNSITHESKSYWILTSFDLWFHGMVQPLNKKIATYNRKKWTGTKRMNFDWKILWNGSQQRRSFAYDNRWFHEPTQL